MRLTATLSRRLAVALLLLWLPGPLVAWDSDGTPICSAAGEQAQPMIVSDGTGGAIAVWVDDRAANDDIYVQRVDGDGQALWTADGIGVCTASNTQYGHHISPDGFGGAVIAWYDYRAPGNPDIYVQRVDTLGAALWTPDGVPACAILLNQTDPKICSDGAGGCIVAWEDERNGAADIYAQRVDASGTVLWTADGVAVCTADLAQQDLRIISDGMGGAFIAWEDYRTDGDIYAQRIDPTGTVLWEADGVGICTASGPQFDPQLAPDGTGGLLVTWSDRRTWYDIYAQRVNAGGVRQWPENGVPVCTVDEGQELPQLVPSGPGGAIIVWQDARNGTNNKDIYAQRVDSLGARLWAEGGVAVCTAPQAQDRPQIAPDGEMGAVITWMDFRNLNNDVFAARLDSLGEPLWQTDGLPLCQAGASQPNPMIASDRSGGGIVIWEDRRDAGDYDIYAQRVRAGGVVGDGAPPAAASDCAATDSFCRRITVTWTDNSLDETAFRLTRTGLVPMDTTLAADTEAFDDSTDLEPGEMYTYSVIALNEFGESDPSNEADGMLRARPSTAPVLQAPAEDIEVPSLLTFQWNAVENADSYWLTIGLACHDPGSIVASFNVAQTETTLNLNPYAVEEIFWWVAGAACGDRGDSSACWTATPVRLLSFTATAVRAGVMLRWRTAAENGVAGFNLYRGLATDPTWQRVNAERIPGGRGAYFYHDTGATSDAEYRYRLTECTTAGSELPLGEARVRTRFIPPRFALRPNVPNPFNPRTTLEFWLPVADHVALDIYDAAGRRVRRLVVDDFPAGTHLATWDGRDDAGRAAGSGSYYARFKTGRFETSRRLMLVR